MRSSKFTPFKTSFVGLSIAALALFHSPSFAALTNLGNGTVLDSDLNLVWANNANLFKTLAASTPGLVGQVIASVDGQITDSAGTYFLGGADFDAATGRLNWYAAKAWTVYLNSISYAGSTHWGLPSLSPVSGGSFNEALSYDGSTDVGYNGAATTSSLGHLFYAELSGRGYYDTNGTPQSGYGLGSTGPFTNLLNAPYWTASEATSADAYYFSTLDGYQASFDKTQLNHVLIAAPVPLPAAVWLLIGAAGWIGAQRRLLTKR